MKKSNNLSRPRTSLSLPKVAKMFQKMCSLKFSQQDKLNLKVLAFSPRSQTSSKLAMTAAEVVPIVIVLMQSKNLTETYLVKRWIQMTLAVT